MVFLMLLAGVLGVPLTDTVRWDQALYQDSFSTEFPAFGEPCPLPTGVSMLQTREALWIRVRAKGPFVKEKAQRDQLGPDFVAVLLDPAGSGGETVYWLGADPAGNQKDQRIQNGVWDPFWNAAWESRVHTDEEGYEVIWRIPFRIFSYQRGPWGFNVIRQIGKTGTVCALAPTPPGQMRPSLKSIHLTLPLQVVFHAYPQGVGLQEKGGNFRGRVGLDASLRLDLHTFWITLFPDYGVADVDPVYVTLDRFAVYLPERRPFFTDEAELFRPPLIPGLPLMDFFYTRAIGDTATGTAGFSTDPASRVPLLGGAKAVLRHGRWLAGGLYARTDVPEEFAFGAIRGTWASAVVGAQGGFYRRDTLQERQVLAYAVGQQGHLQWNLLGGQSDTAWLAGAAVQYATPTWGGFLRAVRLDGGWGARHLAFFPYEDLRYLAVGGGPVWYRKGPFMSLSATVSFRYWDEALLAPTLQGEINFFGVSMQGHQASLSLSGGTASAYFPDPSRGVLRDTVFSQVRGALTTFWNLSPHTFSLSVSRTNREMNYRTYALAGVTRAQVAWSVLLATDLRLRMNLSYQQFDGEHPLWNGGVLVRFSPVAGSQLQVGFSHALTTDPVLGAFFAGGQNHVYLAYEKGLAGVYVLVERYHNARMEPTLWRLRLKVRLQAF